MEIITNSIRAFKAEWIKLKGTGIWWIILIGSGLIPVISAGFWLNNAGSLNRGGATPWEDVLQREVNSFMFLYMLVCILIVVKLCQTEHRSQGWKLIETQPIHRAYIYLGKYTMAAFLSLLSLLLFVMLTLGGGYLIALIQHQEDYLNSSIPWGSVLYFIFRIWIASLGLLAFQYVISIWLTNFVGPFLIGFLLIVGAGIAGVMQSGEWIPHASPGMSSQHVKPGINWFLHNEKLSVAWMLILLWIGYQYYYYRSWKFAVKGGRQLLKIGAAALLFGIAFYFIETPVTYARHDRTVVAGHMISPDSTMTMAVLLNPQTKDTLMAMPIRNGSFLGVYQGDPLKAGDYVVLAGNVGANVYMGDKDSIHIRWNANRMNMGRGPANITGTRQAENAMNMRMPDDGFDLENLQNYKPEVFADDVLKSWQEAIKRVDRFKTQDNIRPAEDFIIMKKKRLTLAYLEKVKIDYPRSFAMYNPGKKLEYPRSLDTLINAVSDAETSLLGYPDYLEYLDKNLRYQGKIRDLSFDSSYFDLVVNSNKPVEVKNAMLYHGMNGMIANYGDSAKRNRLYNSYMGFQKDPFLAGLTADRLALENSLTTGMPAPLFDAETTAGKIMNWTDFKGKYIVVDVWATWCLPCKREDPFFQSYAEMYSNDKMAFVALSIDDGDDQFRWQWEAGQKSKLTVQLRARDKMAFMRKYGIESIPRYMLIDPQGRFLASSLPRPSDRLFEDYLLRVSGGNKDF
jgi:thiol-disulfide isomerase/thioredoxin